MFSKQLITVCTTIVLMAISTTGFGQNKVVVIPLYLDDGVPVVQPYKSVFITAGTFTGNLGGPEGADAKCQLEADSTDSLVQGKVFKAWISGGLATDFSESSRAFNRSALPYRLVGGHVVASNYADLLLDDSFNNPIHNTANGVQLDRGANHGVWTGISDEGFNTVENCDDWTSNGNVPTSVELPENWGGQGSALFAPYWTDKFQGFCGSPSRLYCFEQ